MYDAKLIETRLKKLNEVKATLKNKFIGLDTIIDNIISNIEVWYLMPELLTRPIIVNLWGLTGVGKTDLVRTLVRELEYNEKFVEVQLDTGTESGTYFKSNTIKGEMDSVGLKETDEGILLLDEIQRFRSVDEMGKIINNSKYQDIWMLLSDGKLNTKDFRKRHLTSLLFELFYLKELEEEEKENKKEDKKDTPSDDKEAETAKPSKKSKFNMSLWSAKEIKSSLESDKPLDEIMKWDFHRKVEEIQKKIKSIDTVGEQDRKYAKLLIFISGNIDSAYEMSHDVAETNVDADILHEFSLNINVINIKDALRNSFKPEQIARFGNVHVIYPSLSKKSYYSLIDMKLNELGDKTKEKFDINLVFDDSVRFSLYRNGVYPSQGVRPLFSTIGSVIENSLPIFLMDAVFGGAKTIEFSVDEKAALIEGRMEIDDKTITKTKPIVLQLDSIKKQLNENVFYRTCVHETGHAVAYGLLYKVVPPQIVGDSINSYSNGFVIPHKISGSKEEIEFKMQVLLAGTVSEELIFGANNKGSGASQDLLMATAAAANMIRQYNMNDNVSFIVDNNYQSSYLYNTSINETNEIVEKILAEQKAKVTQLLTDNMEFFREVVGELVAKKRLLPEEYASVSKKYDKRIKVVDNAHKIVMDYKKITEKFINGNN